MIDLKKWWQEQANRRIASWSRVEDSQLIERAERFLSLLDTKLNPQIATLQNSIELDINNLPLTRAATSAKINFANQSLKLSQIILIFYILERFAR